MCIKKTFFFLALALVICLPLHSQVANDDCATAQYWGHVPFQNSVGCFDGSSLLDTTYSGDNINAVVNFPYPQNPSNCLGYTATIAAPANDVWYYLDAYQGTALRGLKIGCSDTVHVSFWIGDSCQNMVPLACYTVPGMTLLDDPTFEIQASLSNAKVFIQVSGVGVGHFMNFQLCMGHTVLSPIFYTFDPTPVLCFAYHLTSQAASSALAQDGSATAHVSMGHAPFTYHWSDNSTDSTLHNAAQGWYGVTITDGLGCVEEDSVFIGSVATAVMAPLGAGKWHVWQSVGTQELFFRVENGPTNGHFQLFDLAGASISPQVPLLDGAASMPTQDLAAGTYLWVWMDESGNRQGGKVLIRH
jgi:hypothetical protein